MILLITGIHGFVGSNLVEPRSKTSSSDRLQKLTENYVVSNQKMKQALGITQLPVGSIEGLERALRIFK